MDIKIYKKHLDLVKEMAKTRYDKKIYNKFYKHTSLSGKAYFGKDWYLNYKVEDDTLTILDWLAMDNGRDFERTSEMAHVFAKLFINHNGVINATLRHGTSWKIYKKMRDLGYFKEMDEYLFIDRESSRKVSKYIDLLIPFENPDYLNKLLEEKDMHEYYPYFLHETEFCITDKFVKSYKKFMI